MMKKLFAVLTITLLLSGCANTPGGESAKKPGSGQPPEQQNSQHQQEPDNQQVYPAQVMNWLETFKPLFVADYLVTPGETFFVVSWGEKNTGGYDVRITDIQETDANFEVTVDFNAPEPGDMVTQAITYPYAVESLEKEINKPVIFKHVDQSKVVPQLINVDTDNVKGFEKKNAAIAVTEFNYTPEEATITGIASTFEASLSYEILNGQGETLKKDYLTAAAGAPNWGAFEFSFTPPVSAEKLQLYEESAKDGSKIHVLEFNLAAAK